METVRDCLSLRHILPLLSPSSSSAPRSSQIIGSAASRAEEPSSTTYPFVFVISRDWLVRNPSVEDFLVPY